MKTSKKVTSKSVHAKVVRKLEKQIMDLETGLHHHGTMVTAANEAIDRLKTELVETRVARDHWCQQANNAYLKIGELQMNWPKT